MGRSGKSGPHHSCLLREVTVESGSPQVNGRRVVLFLLVTFALSWGFEPLIDRFIGHRDFLAQDWPDVFFSCNVL